MRTLPDRQADQRQRVGVMFNRSPLLLDAMATILRTRITIAAKVTTTGEALDMISRHDPDLLIAGLEARKPDNVLALVRQALGRRPSLKVIVLSSSSESRLLIDAFQAGVSAFIAQNASPDDIAVAIRQTTDPSIHFAPEFLPLPKADEPVEVDSVLTERETATVRLLAQGLSNAEIGRTLLVTEQTVKFHVSNILRKLDVTNRTQASRRARLLNLVPDESADVRASVMTH